MTTRPAGDPSPRFCVGRRSISGSRCSAATVRPPVREYRCSVFGSTLASSRSSDARLSAAEKSALIRVLNGTRACTAVRDLASALPGIRMSPAPFLSFRRRRIFFLVRINGRGRGCDSFDECATFSHSLLHHATAALWALAAVCFFDLLLRRPAGFRGTTGPLRQRRRGPVAPRLRTTEPCPGASA